MKYEEKISVILPIHNCESTIARCIESVLTQDFTNYELVIVDDCSTDNTLSVCYEYKKSNPQIKIHALTSNRGVSVARKTGIDKSSGMYIAFIDGDDYYSRDYLTTLYKYITCEQADIAICGFFYVKNNNVVENSVCDKAECIDTESAIKELLLDKRIRNYMWDKLFRRELFDKVVFPKCRYFEDVGIMSDIFVNAKRIILCPQQLYYYNFFCKSLVNRYDHAKFVDCWNQAYGRYNKLLRSNYNIKETNVFALIQWYLRLYKYMVIENDAQDDYLRNAVPVIKQILEDNKYYVLGELSISKRILLFSILYDFDEAKKVVGYVNVRDK